MSLQRPFAALTARRYTCLRSDTLISRNGNSLTLAEGTTADVYDLGGRHIMRVSAGNANLDNLPAGVYLINARGNNQAQTLKIVK